MRLQTFFALHLRDRQTHDSATHFFDKVAQLCFLSNQASQPTCSSQSCSASTRDATFSDPSDRLIMQQSATRSVRLLAMRSFASHAKPHVYMPETAMLTNNVRPFSTIVYLVERLAKWAGPCWQLVQGTHEFKRKGWEYSAYMGMLGGPIILFLGLTNAPETDSDVLAR